MNTSEKRKWILPGGSGFLGRTLAKHLSSQGDEVIVLSRKSNPVEGARVVRWDAKSKGDWCSELEGSRAVVNLAGRSVNCRYHPENRKQMMESRTLSTSILGEAIAACEQPPPVWMNSSTATIYRHRFDAPNDEQHGLYGSVPAAKDRYSIEVAEAWERSFLQAYADHDLTRTRGILLRTAMVFGKQPGGVYEVLLKLARRGLGGKMDSGKQYVSWLHEDDFCGIIEWLQKNDDARGIYNLSAPKPLPNAEMMRLIRKKAGRNFGLPATRWMLELGAFFLRTETELIIKSRRVVPARLLEEQYRFNYEKLDEALKAL